MKKVSIFFGSKREGWEKEPTDFMLKVLEDGPKKRDREQMQEKYVDEKGTFLNERFKRDLRIGNGISRRFDW